jgi:3-hydroxyisobutyrate dehydrogenase-like beta-hydroxyacid dehydrogenase
MMTKSMKSLGWIGAGRMGAAMAARLIAAGDDVTVSNRTRAKADALGARVADAARDLADRDVVFVMVSADADLLAVTTGPGGVLSNPDVAPGVLVDCSTVSTETSAQVRAAARVRGCEFLAAPVSGNPKVVASGGLTMAVSGPRAAFDVVEPYMNQICRGVTYVGEDETARLVKICHNMMLGIVAQAMAEITVLAEKGGVKRSAWLNFLNDSVMGSRFTRYKTPAFVNLDFTPTFTPVLLRKDFDLGMRAAGQHDVVMPLSALCTELVKAAAGAGHATQDFAVLLLEAARAAGLELVPENIVVDDGLGVS